MTSEDHLVLAQQDMSTLGKWWVLLNRWDWPEELPDPEPSEYVPGGRRSELMGWITDAIGLRACLREWNRDCMSEDEFNDFWRGHFEGHQPSKLRYQQRLKEESARMK